MNTLHSLIIILVMAVVTAATRFTPFLVFGNNKKSPDFLSYLGRVLPFAVMGMLVIYCLKGVSFVAYPYGIPEIISCLLVAGLHLWRRNTLISLVSGTVFYMLLVQLVF